MTSPNPGNPQQPCPFGELHLCPHPGTPTAPIHVPDTASVACLLLAFAVIAGAIIKRVRQ